LFERKYSRKGHGTRPVARNMCGGTDLNWGLGRKTANCISFHGYRGRHFVGRGGARRPSVEARGPLAHSWLQTWGATKSLKRWGGRESEVHSGQ